MSKKSNIAPRPMAGSPSGAARRAGWWLFFLMCLFYGGYALWLGLAEALSLADVIHAEKERAVPVVFVLHAAAGGVALVAGSLQFNRRLRRHIPRLHRLGGRIYVGSIWIVSVGGLVSAVFFEVPMAAKIAFAVAAVLWFTTTTVAFVRIRERKVAQHREWMIRSFAFSLFFVTGEVWIAALESTSLPDTIAYPLGVLLGWLVNLLAAEIWIRRTRSPRYRARVPARPAGEFFS